jgi:hypothetical protein
MEFVSLQRNGQPYEPASRREGELTVEPQRQTDRIRLMLRRPHDSSAWLRRCVTPSVSIDGHVLRQRQVRTAAPGTLILFTLNGGVDSIGQSELFENDARGELFLVPRYVAMGFGWVLAAAVFSLSWLIAGVFSRGVDYLFVALFVVVSGSIIWWPWQLPILGWGAVPIVLGALLHLLLAKPVRSPSVSRLETKTDDTRSVRPLDSPDADFSAAARVLLIAVTLTAIHGGRAVAQGNGDELPGEEDVRDAARETTAATPIELLVPLDQSHRPVGDKLYLAQSDYDSILQAVDPNRPVNADFQSAEYRVTLSSPRESTNVIAAEIQADYHIRLPRRTTRVRLPVRAEMLRRIEILSGDETQIARFVIDEEGLVTATIPPDDEVRLRVTFVPTLSVINTAAPAAEAAVAASATEGPTDVAEPAAGDPQETTFGELAEDRRSTIITLAVPPIHASTVVVEAPREITVESLGETLGETRFRAPLGRYEADLGPVNELVITCRTAKPQGQQRPTTIQRMYRIAAGIESTIVECEIDPVQSVAEGEAIQLTILGRAPDGLTSKGWRMVNPETADGAERASTATANLSGGIYRFVKRSDSEAPIRLLWRLPSVLNDPTSTDDSKLMPIPEVFSSGAARGAATLFAIESASSVRVSELTSELQSVSVDDFLAAWRGYPGKIERAFVSRDSFPSFALLRNKLPQPVVKVRHALHVDQDRIELGLRAEIVDLEAGVKRVLVAVPNPFRLVSCAINGQPVASLPTVAVTSRRKDRRTVLPLGDARVEGKMTIELAAERPPIGNQRLALPRFEVLTEGEIDGGYRITRDRSVEVRVTAATNQPSGEADTNAEAMPDVPQMNEADLRVGRIPVAEMNTDSQVALRVRRLPAGNAFPCDQTTVLRYDDGRWSCDTLLKLPAATSPAFVDVQMPSRWTSGLAVSGAETWVQQRSGDGGTTVVRLALPAAAEDATRSVIVSGNLDNRDQVRVSVPDVVVLGAGTRDKFLAVPNQLTTETIQWQPRSVRPVQAAPRWEAPFGSRIEFPEVYSLFAADGPSWSIELEPISQATVDPFAVACDANVILSGGQVLVHQRFDVLPETLASVDMRLPQNATCLGAWAAEREIDLSDIRASSPQSSRGEGAGAEPRGRIELPLAYNRLPQSLEILFRVPVADRQIDDYLARLHGVPTTNRWVVFYDAANRSGGRRLLVGETSLRDRQTGDAENLNRERLVALARAIVTAIDRSRDMLAERSNEEIQQWLMPWIERYRSLASLDGHTPRLDVTQPADAADSEQADNSAPQSASPWPALDEQLRQLVGRFLPERMESAPPLFAPLRFQSYDPVAVVRLDNLRELPTLRQTFVPRKSLQRLLIDWITLITFGLGVILLWPFRGRFQGWITHPALWLFLTGAVSVVLIPPPIAVSLMLLAASLPVLRGTKRMA